MLENKKIIYSALIVSLALNCFIIGGAGFYALKWKNIRADGNWIEKRLDRAESRFLRHLEGQDKILAKQVFSERRPALRNAVKEVRAARHDFRQSLSVETPNPVKITASLDRSQKAAAQVNENFHGALRDMAQGLSPEARRNIAEHMKRHRHHDEAND
tara:strand:+ start:1456 stop:1929 length:474 start_codon:yes stop_codon:yes gene_type:complete